MAPKTARAAAQVDPGQRAGHARYLRALAERVEAGEITPDDEPVVAAALSAQRARLLAADAEFAAAHDELLAELAKR